MSIVRLAALLAFALPGMACASNTFNVAISSCSGTLLSSSTDGLSLECSGDFSLSNGVIHSDTSVFLSATGSLQLTDISITGHSLTLSAGGQLDIDPRTSLSISDRDLLAPLVVAAGSAAIRVGGGLELRQDVTREVIQWPSFDISTASAAHFQQPAIIQLSTVPEPDRAVLMLAGLMAIGLAVRKSSKA
jgi:hypothetical protein